MTSKNESENGHDGETKHPEVSDELHSQMVETTIELAKLIGWQGFIALLAMVSQDRKEPDLETLFIGVHNTLFDPESWREDALSKSQWYILICLVNATINKVGWSAYLVAICDGARIAKVNPVCLALTVVRHARPFFGKMNDGAVTDWKPSLN